MTDAYFTCRNELDCRSTDGIIYSGQKLGEINTDDTLTTVIRKIFERLRLLEIEAAKVTSIVPEVFSTEDLSAAFRKEEDDTMFKPETQL
jgi:hypothetical protein